MVKIPLWKYIIPGCQHSDSTKQYIKTILKKWRVYDTGKFTYFLANTNTVQLMQNLL